MIQYLREVRAEMRHVSWPTRRQTIISTAVVIAISLAAAVYLGLFDYLFSTFIFRIV
ncbi:preprotein translocase subunit SecE [Candidatus Adlerbacteria bacterium RIFCSPHIGHO2_12_FULL_53_18]|uniref:Protein translocase subunit SecE n=1 Tax=Candidatus Adlerbacteria bacterium RIFCSPHIGHO2_12_FULL_53_18 TaxID=1797242 RepID=A0A1F4XS32_9BACT|nr:MAG: preprotein translocase subunit SecE [Candidatus Adlerbacteria bacterium RIFCSPHIGHO2_12_FULL_53_18]